jgi:predicted lipoprotein with Yx(FWY)xxD motif
MRQARGRGSARVVALGVAAAIGLLVAACGDDGSTTASTSGSGATTTADASSAYAYGAPAATTTVAPAAATTTAAAAPATTTAGSSAVTVKVATTTAGSVLVDSAGMTLYVFTKDEKNKSNCTGGCLTLWPPYYGPATAGAGVDASKLGSFTTTDGKTQVTIDGMPVYHYSPDKAPGDATGQNVGGVWFVVDGSGVIKK